MRRIAIRIDDITPAMDWESFRSFRDILEQEGIQPLIGVVPFNQDVNLNKGAANPDFWEEMRTLQKKGWLIALHGYHHLYQTKSGGIFPLNSFSEFAGVSLAKQTRMIQEGKQELERQGLQVELFMAPGHTFDCNTLHALKEADISYVTDGFGSYAYQRNGITFLPIAFHTGKLMKASGGAGITTIVYHINGYSQKQLQEVAYMLRENRERFVSYADLLGEVKRLGVKKATLLQVCREYLMAKMKWILVRVRSLRG